LDPSKAIHPFPTSFLEAIILVEADATAQNAQQQKNYLIHAKRQRKEGSPGVSTE